MNNWRKAATGQHIELGIAENNLLLLVMIAPHPPLPHHPPRRASTSLPPRAHTVPLLPSPVQSLRPQMAAAGLSAELFGHRLFPVGTLYDPFVCRALDSLIYGTYMKSRFMLIGTPSGITRAPMPKARPIRPGPPAFPQPASPKREAALGLVLPLGGPVGVRSGQK